MTVSAINDTFVYVGSDGKVHEAEGTFVGSVSGGVFTPATFLPPGLALDANSVPTVESIETRRYRRPNQNFRLLSSAATVNLTGGSTLANARALHIVRGRKATANSCFLKLYDKASAPVVATDVPFMTLELIANATFDLDFKGYPLVNGLAFAITAASADTDNTAVASGDILSLNIATAT